MHEVVHDVSESGALHLYRANGAAVQQPHDTNYVLLLDGWSISRDHSGEVDGDGRGLGRFGLAGSGA